MSIRHGTKIRAGGVLGMTQIPPARGVFKGYCMLELQVVFGAEAAEVVGFLLAFLLAA